MPTCIVLACCECLCLRAGVHVDRVSACVRVRVRACAQEEWGVSTEEGVGGGRQAAFAADLVSFIQQAGFHQVNPSLPLTCHHKAVHTARVYMRPSPSTCRRVRRG